MSMEINCDDERANILEKEVRESRVRPKQALGELAPIALDSTRLPIERFSGLGTRDSRLATNKRGLERETNWIACRLVRFPLELLVPRFSYLLSLVGFLLPLSCLLLEAGLKFSWAFKIVCFVL